MVVYFDDILIYSKEAEQHLEHLKRVFELLRENTLYVHLKKGTFMVDKLLFLGFVISSEGIQVDNSKVRAISEWPKPRNIKELQNFHGLATFYRKFIKHFSSIASLLTDSVKKGSFV